MQVDKPGRIKAPRVAEVLSTQQYTFNREPSQPTAAQRPTIPAGHPGMAKLNQQQSTSIPDPQPKSHSETEAEYVTVDLPSLGRISGIAKVSIRPLKGVHIAKFNRAHKEESVRHIVDAISSTLEPSISAYDLPPGDFYYLMYWQRVNSYPKSPMLIEAWCTDLKHNLEVTEGVLGEDGEPTKDEEGQIIKKEKETLHLKDIVNMTTLVTENLKEVDFEPFKDLHDKYTLGYETMRDVVNITEEVTNAEEIDSEYVFLAGKAAWLLPLEGRMTLRERVKIVEQMDPDELELLDKYKDVVTDFGVSESTQLRCKECGASTRINISFDALTFLPSGG